MNTALVIARRYGLFFLIVLLATIVLGGCSGSKQSAHSHDFEVEYFSEGGVAGTSEGFTLSSHGQVKFWHGRTPDSRIVADSIVISDEKLHRISDLLEREDLYSVHRNATGNMVYVLTIRHGAKSNMITMTPDAPPDSPASLTELLKELKEIHKP